MNRHEIERPGGEAEVRYLDGDFQLVSPGAYVRCAVTGLPVPLGELRYWSVDRQEAYLDAEIAMRRFEELSGAGAEGA